MVGSRARERVTVGGLRDRGAGHHAVGDGEGPRSVAIAAHEVEHAVVERRRIERAVDRPGGRFPERHCRSRSCRRRPRRRRSRPCCCGRSGRCGLPCPRPPSNWDGRRCRPRRAASSGAPEPRSVSPALRLPSFVGREVVGDVHAPAVDVVGRVQAAGSWRAAVDLDLHERIAVVALVGNHQVGIERRLGQRRVEGAVAGFKIEIGVAVDGFESELAAGLPDAVVAAVGIDVEDGRRARGSIRNSRESSRDRGRCRRARRTTSRYCR